MIIDPVLLATLTGFVGAIGAMCWSYLMASKVAAPRAKRLIVEALTNEGPELEAVRAHLIDPAMKQATAAVEVPDFEFDTEALVSDLKPHITETVMMAIRQVQAQETKAFTKQLAELGIDEAIEEGKAMVEANLPQGALQAQKLLNFKVSRAYAKEHPVHEYLIEASKLQLMQWIQGQMGVAGGHAEPAAQPSSNRGFGVR